MRSPSVGERPLNVFHLSYKFRQQNVNEQVIKVMVRHFPPTVQCKKQKTKKTTNKHQQQTYRQSVPTDGDGCKRIRTARKGTLCPPSPQHPTIFEYCNIPRCIKHRPNTNRQSTKTSIEHSTAVDRTLNGYLSNIKIHSFKNR